MGRMLKQMSRRSRVMSLVGGGALALAAATITGIWLIGTPASVRPIDDVDVLSLSGVFPGMSKAAVRGHLRADGWERAQPEDHRLARSGVLRAEEVYSRSDRLRSEAIGIDYVLHPSGEWAATVHHAVLSGSAQVSDEPGKDDLGPVDRQFEEMRATVTASMGDVDYKDVARINAWWMCCQETSLGWNEGLGLRLRYGYGFRMLTVGWKRGDILKALDGATDTGRDWAEAKRLVATADGMSEIDRLMQAGSLRPATHEDARDWLQAHTAWAGDAIWRVSAGSPDRLRELLGLDPDRRRGAHNDAYVVVKPLENLPRGFADGRPRQFLVPPEGPVPSGDWGNNEVYLMDGGVCRTAEGQCPSNQKIFEAWREMRQGDHPGMALAGHHGE